MKKQRFLVVGVAAAACMVSPLATAAYKCMTKQGVTYQDKPCADVQQNEAPANVSTNVERQRHAERSAERPYKTVAAEGQRTTVDVRRDEELAEQKEWLERSARKVESLKVCATGEVKCTADWLRTSALYLSESQLENALGAPAGRQQLGLARTSQWSVRLNDAGRRQSLKLIAAWGLCSDDRGYFAPGAGARACKVDVE